MNAFGTAGPGAPLVIGEGGYGRAFQSPDSFYTIIEGTIEGLPGLEWWSWGFASHASDHPTGGYEDIDLAASSGGPVAPGVELYLDNPPPGAYRVSWVSVRYAIGCSSRHGRGGAGSGRKTSTAAWRWA